MDTPLKIGHVLPQWGTWTAPEETELQLDVEEDGQGRTLPDPGQLSSNLFAFLVKSYQAMPLRLLQSWILSRHSPFTGAFNMGATPSALRSRWTSHF